MSGYKASINFTGTGPNSITTAASQNFAINPGLGGLIGINTAALTPLSSLDIRPNLASGGTISVASVSGTTAFASLVVDQSGLGDIFTASAAGLPLFTIQRNGNIVDSLAKSVNFSNAALTVASCTGCATAGTNWWNLVNGNGVTGGGYITPINSTADLLIGGQSTASATFAVLGLATNSISGVGGHQTTASVSGNFVVMPNNGYGGNVGIGNTNPGTALDVRNPLGTATIASVSGDLTVMNNGGWGGFVGIGTNAPLTALDIRGTVGSSVIASVSGRLIVVSNGGWGGQVGIGYTSPGTAALAVSGNVGIGTTSPLATLHVVGQYGSNAALIVNQLNNGDLFTASYSGATKFTITNQGGINLGGTVGLGSNCLLGGTTASWGSCSTGVGISPFTEVTGVNGGYITANNSTEDFLFGSQATSSATFHLFGSTALAGTQPVASIGAKTSFAALVVDQSGLGDLFTASAAGLPLFTIQRSGSLVMSGYKASINFTGTGPNSITTAASQNFAINPGLGGLIGINTAALTPLSSLDIRPNLASGGTISVASVSGKTSFAAMVVDQSGTGDIFTASDSGATRFDIRQNGSVGINTATPTAMLDVAGAASLAGQLTFKNTFGQIQTTADQQLTLGGATTGKILLAAYNGSVTAAGNSGGIVFGGYNSCTLKTDATGTLQCQTDLTSGTSTNPFAEVTGVNGGYITANNSTEDFLFGSQATSSATFHLFGSTALAGTQPVASIGAKTSFAAMVVDQSGLGDLFTASAAGKSIFTITRAETFPLPGICLWRERTELLCRETERI